MIHVFSQYVSPKSILVVLLESLVIAVSLLVAVKLRFWNDPAEFDVYIQWPDFAFQTLAVVVVFLLCSYYNDLYHFRVIRRRSEQLARLGQSFGAACLILGLLYFLFPALLIGRGVFFITLALAGAAVVASRILLDAAWRRSVGARSILILGVGELASTVAQEIACRKDLNVLLAGFVDTSTEAQRGSSTMFGHSIFRCPGELERIVLEHQASWVIVAIENGEVPIQDLVRLRIQGVKVEDAYSAIAALTGRVWLHGVPSTWFVFSDGFSRSRRLAAVKRIVDLILAGAGLLLAAPLMGLVAVAIRLESQGPILYRQIRVGWKGRQFELLKFRSMRPDAEQDDTAKWAEPDDPRATALGRFLRKYRFDELPQFLNVIRGDMSFVGPRPERPVFVERLREQIPYFDERHSVRPGLTGWAQVQYPYCASVEDTLRKLEYDMFYLKNMSVLFDCAIVLQTVRIVLLGRGGR